MSIINREIKSSTIKLVTDEGIKELSFKEAINLAEEDGLDLVEVSKEGDTSICKIMDYSKHLYTQKKKEKGQPKKENIKEVKFGSLIAEHDLVIKANNIDRLVTQGHKVKVSIMIKGNRGRDNNKIGLEIYNKLMNIIGERVTIISELRVEGQTGTFTVKGK